MTRMFLIVTDPEVSATARGNITQKQNQNQKLTRNCYRLYYGTLFLSIINTNYNVSVLDIVFHLVNHQCQC